MRKKVFLLINSLEMGGAERVILEFYSTLSKKYDLKLFTLKDVKEYKTKINYTPLSRAKKDSALLIALPSLSKKFRKAIEQEKPDIIISFLELSNFVSIYASKKLDKKQKTKTFISVRSTLSEVYDRGIYGKIFTGLIKKLYPQADYVITNSENSREDLAEHFTVDKNRIFTIYNPLNIKLIKQKSGELLDKKYESIFSKKNIVLINIGRINDAKAQFNLIRIFSEIKKEKNSEKLKLVILGTGPLEDKLRKGIKELNLEKDVFLPGNVENPFVFIKNSDIFVFTSVYEGFPNALTEAMACGLPVISTDCRSGPREILSPKTKEKTGLASKPEFAEYGVLCPVFEKGRT
ncbi:MAG: glycosyltransferase, partial [Candidatus Nanoarchaeia archaeon]